MRFALLFCYALLLLSVSTAMYGADLAAQAAQRRAAAETALEQQRAGILKQRQQLLAQFAELQQQLSTLKKEADQSSEAEERLRLQAQQRDQAADEAADALQLRIGRVCAALGVAEPEQYHAEACRLLWRGAIQRQLQTLDQQALLRIEQQDIAGRDGEPQQVRLIHCGAVQELAVGDSPLNSGLVLHSNEVRVINGPMIGEAGFAALQQLDAQSGGFLIADVEGSLKQQDLQIESWSAWLAKGGFFVWPIMAVGVIALLLATERIFHVVRLRIQPEFLQQCIAQLEKGEIDTVKQSVSARSNPLQRVLAAGLAALDQPQEIRESALEASLLAEEAGLDRSRSLLAVLAAVAPLLGLLGTVTGMIATFHSIALFGTTNPALLSNGISQALITTQLGLVVAVPILLVHGFIHRISEKRRIILEQAAGHVLSVRAS